VVRDLVLEGVMEEFFLVALVDEVAEALGDVADGESLACS
jgi:hypothetical protein